MARPDVTIHLSVHRAFVVQFDTLTGVDRGQLAGRWNTSSRENDAVSFLGLY
jgi:hypothetical protein